MLSITKDKQTRILEKRVARNNLGGANIFGGIGRQNNNRNEAMDELRQLHIPEDMIQLAL